MKEILIFAGTTEGRELSERLAAAGIRNQVCVATEYGELLLSSDPFVKVHRGRMGMEEMKKFIEEGDFGAVVDATHPYAEMVTSNIKEAVKGMEIPYLRLKREAGGKEDDRQREEPGQVAWFEDNRACARALESVEGNILLTVGTRELEEYCVSEKLRCRLYVRVLPAVESLLQCADRGIGGKQIIAMQGPFSTEMNEAVIRQYGITCLVTKDSGRAGGYGEKLEAARRAGIKVCVIGRPGEDEEGIGFEEVCGRLGEICGREIGKSQCASEVSVCLEIILAGVGMGSESCITKEVQEAIRRADILMGAKRLLARYPGIQEKYPFYQAKQIIPFLQKTSKKKVVILFSGDAGFYSGCSSVYEALKKEIVEGRLAASVRIMPGISSVAYLASSIGECYEEAAIYSIHGRDVCNLGEKIKRNRKTFLLVSGVREINQLGELLEKQGLSSCMVIIGYQMSYENQEVRICTPRQCCELKKEGLYTCLIKNPHVREQRATHGLRDTEFIRDRVPMTKEEVREVSICKLHLHQRAVVYDIGSGTGSMAVEIAGLSDEIQVYAIEKKAAAVSLIEENKAKFQLENISVIKGEAPEELAGLPSATHAFIGGSSGRLKEILDTLRQINPQMRVVINAVSIETICELKEILGRYKTEEEELVQLQVSRMKKAGEYHLMSGENPVWICAFCFLQEDNDNES